jgi:hypothetical protein
MPQNSSHDSNTFFADVQDADGNRVRSKIKTPGILITLIAQRQETLRKHKSFVPRDSSTKWIYKNCLLLMGLINKVSS